MKEKIKKFSMTHVTPDKELVINTNIYDEVGQQVEDYIIDNKRIFLEANPGIGKTYYFAQLGKQIKRGNSPFKRLIFITPRLIIQDQIQQDLKVDFKLNGTTKKKDLQLKPDHKVITSTYDSLYKIKNQINDTDLLVVDEAHELLSIYKSNDSKPTQYYDDVIEVLYTATASLVLMTGTTINNFHRLLDLKHLKISKENTTKTKVNIGFSKDKIINIASYYSGVYIKKYSTDRLNIIYIKNKEKCKLIANHLTDKGFNAKILTSENKQSDVYINLAVKNLIPSDIQFIITTNVISVGANILNTNIGGVLMIDEYNPLDIKQFVKRFRKANTLTIDLINRGFVVNSDASVNRMKMFWDENDHIARYFFKHLNDLKTKPEFHGNGYFAIKLEECFIDNDCKTSITELEKRYCKDYLKTQTYKYNEFNSLINTPELLKESLNLYDDIDANDNVFNYNLYQSLSVDVSKKAKKSFKNKVDDILDHFIANYQEYLLHCKIKLKHTDYGKYEIFASFFDDKLDLGFDQKIMDNVSHPLFDQYIIDPVYQYIIYIKNIKKCLEFIRNTPPNKRNEKIVAIIISDLISKYCDIVIMNGSYIIDYKKGTDILQDSRKNDKLLLELIKLTFKELINNDYYHPDTFKVFLNNNKKAKGLIESMRKKNEFPFNLLHNDNNIPSGFASGIVRGLFQLKASRSRIQDNNGARISVYKFEDNINNINASTVLKSSLRNKTRTKILSDRTSILS